MSERAISLAEKHPDIWATIGIHPNDNRADTFDEEIYLSMAKHPRVVAIGECGIEYFRLEELRKKGVIENMDREADRQQELFDKHMEIAVSADKPLMIHGRPSEGSMDAYEDILHILKNGQAKYGERVRGNVHFFVGDTAIAKQFLDLGFTMSFTGVVTFARDYDDVVRYIPLDMIHAETDAPYVAPVPHRGKRNEPAYVREIVARIATIKGMENEDVEKALLHNARRVYGL
jgi:TatD DNase family protein